MRVGRLLIGATVVLIALWVIIGEQITGVSSNAIVNARLSTVRTPVAGVLDMPLRTFGATIAEGEQVASVHDGLVDTVRLNDLQLEQAYLQSQAVHLASLIAIADAEIANLRTRNEIYTAARMAEAEAQLSRASERVALLGLPEPKDNATADSVELSRALEEYETLQITRNAITDGVFLGDSYNDIPFSGQRLIEQKANRASLSAQLTESEQRLAALKLRVTQENARVGGLSGTSLNAPSEGVLWEVLAGDGEIVQRGQDIVKLMNCGSALVTLSVPDNVYNRLRVGQTAKFRLDGTEALYDGTITRIAGAGAQTIYRNLAVSPSEKHLERYDIALLVPALREDTHLRCTVGQTGRVFFDTRSLDWLRDILN